MRIYRHVFVLDTCLDVIIAESKKVRFKETGGPLVGYISNDHALVITGATGPGPKAELSRYSVVIDGEFAQKFCDEMYSASSGKLDYVGDWHRHTGWSLEPSKEDVHAMRTMADFEYCPVKHPVSLIYRKRPAAFKTYVLNAERELDLLSHSILPARAVWSMIGISDQ